MRRTVEELLTLYVVTSENLLSKKQPKMVITQLILLALCDHFDVMINEYNDSNDSKGPHFHYYQSMVLGQYLNSFKYSAHLATQQPTFDQRWLELRSLYKKNSHGDMNRYMLSYYNKMINMYPTLKKELEELYHQKYAEIKTLEHEKIQEEKFTALYYLFNAFYREN